MNMFKTGTERRRFFFDYLVKEKYRINSDYLYKPRDGDVVIIGPPKSGTTWLQQICHQIRTKGDESFDDIYDVTRYIAHPTGQLYDVNGEQVCQPRIFKHHEVHGVIETTDKQKHILILRDPYDTTLSWIKFLNRWYGGDEDMDENEAIRVLQDLHKNKKLSHFDVMSSWWSHRNDPNVLQLFYEDAVAQPKLFIKTVSEFLSIELSENELNRVAHLCSFEWMQENKEKFRNALLMESRALATGIEKWTPKIGMVSPGGGKVGQGKLRLSNELKSILNELWEESMLKVYGFKNYQQMYNEFSLFNNTKSML